MQQKNEHKEVETPYRPNNIQKIAHIGIKFLLPHEFELCGIAKSAESMKVIDALIYFQSRSNDVWDFGLSQKAPELEKQVSTINQERDTARRQLTNALEQVENPAFFENLIKNYQQEAYCVETHIRHIQKTGNLTLNDIREYRETSNAIATVTLVAAILGEKFFDTTKTAPILEEEFNYREVRSKYLWLMYPLKKQRNTRVDNATIAIFNTAMAAQIDDDKAGKAVDQWLAIPTFASAVENEKPADAKILLDMLKQNYLDNAIKYGLKPIAQHGMNILSIIGQSISHKQLQLAIVLSNEVMVKNFPVRERLFAASKIGNAV